VTSLLTKTEQALSFGLSSIDNAFLGFRRGDFAVLYGHQSVKTLSFLLSVRCLLPLKEGGINSSTIYLDGGNTFDPYAISTIARQYGFDPQSVLERIFVSRAFTAYQLSALIFETLEDALKKYKSGLILISNFISLFLDRDVPMREAIEIFRKAMIYLSDLATRCNVIVIASYFPHELHRRRVLLESFLLAGARTTIKIQEFSGRLQFSLEKHPLLKPCTIDILLTEVMLERFEGA